MAKHRFSRRYPRDWSILKIADFMADCRRVGNIPRGIQPTSKRKGDMIEVTWIWKD